MPPASAGDALSKRSPPWVAGLRVALVIGVLAFLFATGRLSLDAMWKSMSQPLFALLIGLQVLVAALNLGRWVYLVRQAAPLLARRRIWRAALRAQFATLVLPGIGGSEVVRLSSLPGVSRTLLGGTLAADRVFALYGLAASLGLSSLAVALSERADALRPLLKLAVLVVAGVALSPLFLLWGQKLLATRSHRWLVLARGILEQLWRPLSSRRTFVTALSVSVISQWLNGAAMGVALLAGGESQMAAALVAMPLISLAAALPVTPQGLGVTEVASEGLFGLVGIHGGAVATVSMRLAWMVVTLAMGFSWLGETPVAADDEAPPTA